MVVHDLLYGRWEIPAALERLATVPEVRRLSQIRLLNCLTPSLSSLGEVRRFSHTLGVLYLWSRLRKGRWSSAEYEALGAAILLHDVGTPPFGHLFEYQLRELYGWSHEAIIHSVLWGFAAPEDKAHQIFAGRTAQFRKELQRARISETLVSQMVMSEHPLSRALFGSLDLDNLDNVARMTAYLGFSGSAAVAAGLAERLEILPDGSLVLDEELGRPLVGQWQDLRRSAYEVLVFDSPTVAAQAVLSDAIRAALESGELTVDDWCLSDEELLRRLGSSPVSRRAITSEYLGELPQLVCAAQVAGELRELGHDSLSALRKELVHAVRGALEDPAARVYVFVDKGTFSKRLGFVNADGRPWTLGADSGSIVVHAFSGARRSPSRLRRREALAAVLKCLRANDSSVLRTQLDVVDDVERTLNF